MEVFAIESLFLNLALKQKERICRYVEKAHGMKKGKLDVECVDLVLSGNYAKNHPVSALIAARIEQLKGKQK